MKLGEGAVENFAGTLSTTIDPQATLRFDVGIPVATDDRSNHSYTL